MNRLNQTEPATFSILPCWAFFRDSVFIYFFIDGIPDDDDDVITDKAETRKGHHRNASVIFITQTLFQQFKDSQTISLNAHYMISF
jgi:hypothetical protein